MKVTALVRLSHPDGRFTEVGEDADLDDAIATQLVDEGSAEKASGRGGRGGSRGDDAE